MPQDLHSHPRILASSTPGTVVLHVPKASASYSLLKKHLFKRTRANLGVELIWLEFDEILGVELNLGVFSWWGVEPDRELTEGNWDLWEGQGLSAHLCPLWPEGARWA